MTWCDTKAIAAAAGHRVVNVGGPAAAESSTAATLKSMLRPTHVEHLTRTLHWHTHACSYRHPTEVTDCLTGS